MSSCEICHKELALGVSTFEQPYHYTESGLSHVYLINVKTYTCPECQLQTADIPWMNKLHQLISKDILLTPQPMDGELFRFLRKETRLRPREFAERIGVDPKTVSNWEKAENLNRQNDVMIRFFVAGELFTGRELQEVISQLVKLSEYSWEPEDDGDLDQELVDLAATNTLLGITSDEEWLIAA